MEDTESLEKEPIVEVRLIEIDAASEMADIQALLCGSHWPFHRLPRLSSDQVRSMSFGLPSTRSFWVEVDDDHAGLLRVQDIGDIGDGSPVLDVRIAEGFRGRGVGNRAVRMLASLVFGEYPAAHRIEAATRADHVMMRRVLERCGFRLEGLLRETWPTEEGQRLDTAIYGLLRRECGQESLESLPPR